MPASCPTPNQELSRANLIILQIYVTSCHLQQQEYRDTLGAELEFAWSKSIVTRTHTKSKSFEGDYLVVS